MNKLAFEARTRILQLLCEGMTIRGVSRVTGVSKNTVSKLLDAAGLACRAYHDEHVQNLDSEYIRCEEIWSFRKPEARNITASETAPTPAGDIWTWVAIAEDSGLALSWLIGTRDTDHASELVQDIARRLAGRVFLVADDPRLYIDAAKRGFQGAVVVGPSIEPCGRLSDAVNPDGAAGHVDTGNAAVTAEPDKKRDLTPCGGRQDPVARRHMKNFAWPADPPSRKVKNHVRAVALHFMHYNFLRIRDGQGMTPAMASGITDSHWETSDIAALVEARETGQGHRRGP